MARGDLDKMWAESQSLTKQAFARCEPMGHTLVEAQIPDGFKFFDEKFRKAQAKTR